MRYIKMWRWIPLVLVLLVLTFVQVDLAETRVDPLDQRIVPQAGSPTSSEEMLERSSLHMVGQVGGRTEDVAVQGDYAYVAVGLRLVVLDVSQPITPTQIGSTTPFPQFVAGVTVSGTLACVADGVAGLRVVDVSNPSAPVEIGVYDTPGYAEGVAVAGQYAYVADGHYGLRIVDVSDPAHPVEVAYAYPLNYVFDVAVDGQYAYLAAAGAGLLVVDVSEPARPVELGSLDTLGYAYGVDADGDVVYVADGWEGLRVVSVADPAQPVEVGSYDTPGWAFGVNVVGSRAYVADAFGGLQIVDVSDPAHPTSLGGEEVRWGHAGRVAVVGNTAYVADLYRGLRVVDVSDPAAPAQVGTYSPLSCATAVAVSGNRAYVAAARQGLRVVDISDPTHPVELGAYETRSEAIGVAVVGNYVYIATWAFGTEVEDGLHVVDVSDPTRPTRAGFLEPTSAYRDMVVAGGMAYIADERGLDVIDVSSPYTPTLAADISLQGEEPGVTTSVDVSGTLAYVAGDGGFHIVDVSNPASPTLINHSTVFEAPFDVAVAGTTAYVTQHGGDALKIIDVSDPLHPALLGACRGPRFGFPQRVTVVSGTAYVAFGIGGLYAIDVTDPLSPTLAFSYDTPGYAIASAVVSNTIYVADADGGLVVLETREAQSEAFGPMWRGPLFAENVQSGGLPDWPPMSRSGGSASPIYRNNHRPDLVHKQLPQPQPDVQLAAGARRTGSSCVVTSTADSGPGTLRECMENAVSGDTITFAPAVFPPTSPVAIALTNSLPAVSQGNITLDASNAGVILDGKLQALSVGIGICSDNNVIMGLQILNFTWAGVHIWDGAKHNVIGGNRTRGDGPTGEGNVISGNGTVGVILGETGTMNNIIIGNLIGTDVSGTSVLGNGFDGVDICHGASHNTIGGPIPGEGNVISGNKNAGVWIGTEETMGNTIIGNFIGTDMHGTTDLGNVCDGVLIADGAFNNTVKGNVISCNGFGGVAISSSDYNVVVGNLIGTDATGTSVLGNGRGGVSTFVSSFNRIGGTSPGERNVISGNPCGITLGEYDEHNLILGNFIGTDVHGTSALSNTRHGIVVWSGRSFVGGATDAERNVISGNGCSGISFGGAEHAIILNNYIGTDVTGMTALPNKWNGINGRGAKHTVIQGNLIAGNSEIGVQIGELSDFSHVRANHIGVAADGASPLPNGMAGLNIAASSNIVGGTYPEDGNIIAFNGWVGVKVRTYSGNMIRRNSIYSNSHAGISLADGGNNLLAAPVITDVLPSSVSGTACPGCIVEIFSDPEDEGKVYEGSVTADGQGNWTWIGSPSGPYVTATATDGAGNTSPFSTPKRK